jgi:chromate transporter
MGIVPTMLLAGAVGVALYSSRTWGILSGLVILVLYSAHHWGNEWWALLVFTGTEINRPVGSLSPDLWDIGLFFLKVGAFSFGGGLTILAFIQDQVVHHLHWLTPQQFLDGLALGQLTPGPILLLAAFVGYGVGSISGAVVAAAAVYLPSFILMFSVLPCWAREARVLDEGRLAGHQPAVIGVTAVAVLRMVPYAIPDLLTGALAVGTLVVLVLWRLSPCR